MVQKPRSPLAIDGPVEVEDEMEWKALRAAWIRQLEVDPGLPGPGADRIQLCRCVRSQLQFFWPMHVAGSGAFYERLERFPWYYQTAKWDYTHAMGYIREGSRLLDIGCGVGHFLAIARNHGVAAEGVALNPHAVTKARAAGFEVSEEPIERLAAKSPGAYDTVTAFQVLEHVEDPRGLIASACRLLRPGGRLIVAVPHSAGWLSRAGGVIECPPHHVSRWNPAALSFLATLFPLEVVAIDVAPLERGQIGDFAHSVVAPADGLAALTRRRTLRERLLARLVAFAIRRSERWSSLPGVSLMAVFDRGE